MSWPKKLTVDKQIVGLLSSQTYEAFPSALREAVSNSFDADATRVDIAIRRDTRVLEIVDNGAGMTPDEFDFYLRIAGRRPRASTTRLGRQRIGKFGVGFLSLFPFCQVLEVESTILNSPRVFRATISAQAYMSADSGDVDATPVEGVEFDDPARTSRHYTRLRLTGLTNLVDRYLDDRVTGSGESLSVRSWPGLTRLRWQLSETLPVPWNPGALLGRSLGNKTPTLTVVLNGTEIRRQDYCEEILEAREATLDGIHFRYAVGTPWRAVHPYEARGLKIRVRGVGVGERTNFDLQIHGRTYSRLHWLSGEIEVDNGLDDALQLNRESFAATDEFDTFRSYFRDVLRRLADSVEAVDVTARRVKKLSRELSGPEGLAEIAKQVEPLRKRGFEVRHTGSTDRNRDNPVEVDLRRKTVTLHTGHPQFRPTQPSETIETELTWREWDAIGPFRAIRRAPDGTIEYNRRYPPFTGPNRDLAVSLHRNLFSVLTLHELPPDVIEGIEEAILAAFEERR